MEQDAAKLILLVEDEEDIAELLRYNLKKAGYRLEVAPSGEEGWKKLEETHPDLILLDWMLPGMSGLELLQRLRRHPRHKHVAVLMLTAKGEEADIVTGLEQGADDYLPKPFSNKVLLARIQGLLRRGQRGDKEERMQVLELVIFPKRHEVLLAGQPLTLTRGEYRMLLHLAKKPGWAFSRDQLMDAAHGNDHIVTDRSVDVMIAGLRKKLGKHEDYIETLRGTGYRFKALS